MQTLLKGLERLVLWDLEESVLKDKPICSSQWGFKKGISCEHALSHLVDKIESSILQDQYCLAVFCDIEAAFDTIKTASLIKCLEERNFPKKNNKMVYTLPKK